MNIIDLTSNEKLEEIISNKNSNKLNILFFHTRNNVTCRTCKNNLERLSNQYENILVLCLEVEIFKSSRYFNNIKEIPTIHFYTKNYCLGTLSSPNLNEIEDAIQKAMIWIKKNFYAGNDKVQNVLQNQLLNEKINPNDLQNNMQNRYNNLNNNDTYYPSFQQMQYLFHIFTTLQKMGVLTIPEVNKSDPLIIDKEQVKDSETIVLPSGEKLILLENGTYGLLKNENN